MSVNVMTNDLLTVDSVSVAYGEQTAIRSIDISVRQGTVTALLGPNGAGKTTLLRAIAGLQACTDGRILLKGQDLRRVPAHKRARQGICLIPEGRGIFHSLTVSENLRSQFKPGDRDRDFSSALEAFPVLKDRLSQTAGTMSGGQQQMLALARCYLARPQVILLDEVSMGLAPLVVDQIFESIRHLAENGISLLLVEQYVDRALDLADQVYVLNRGSLVFVGAASDLSRDELIRSYLGSQ